MKSVILFFSILYSLSVYSQEKPSYPEPEKGMKRVDLKLPKIENDKEYKVEIRFGIEMNISECSDINDFSFNIKNLEKRYGISPSRFPYYVLPKEIPTEVLTFYKSNCDKTKTVKKKVLSSQNILQEYNGHISIPFYIPKDWTLEYRLWKVNSEFKNAEL